MAVTHTEIYRRFDGALRSHPLRFLPLTLAGIKVATRRKLPLILLFAPPAISGIVISFIVYGKFTLESGMGMLDSGSDPRVMMAAGMAGRLVEVREQIVISNHFIRAFALLVIAWFGAGLISDDRKAGATLLYFSRPLTRIDYYLGHFGTVAFFGLGAILGPGLMVCIVAVFSSEDYAFLKQEWRVIVATVGYAALYVATLSALVLAVSSLVSRKAFALAGVFGLVLGSQAVAMVLMRLRHDRDFQMVSLWGNFHRLGDWMFDARRTLFHWAPHWSLIIVLGLLVLAVAVCGWRIRRMEAVA